MDDDDPAADLRLAVAAFDAVSPAAALELVRPVCASPAWMDAIVARRPYGSLDAVLETSATVVAGLGRQQLDKALDAHPRVGERAVADALSPAQQSSPAEQAGAAGIDPEVQRRIVEAQQAYEQKFGHVFLICATELSAGQTLAALEARLGHDRAVEELAVRRELAAVTALRLRAVLA